MAGSLSEAWRLIARFPPPLRADRGIVTVIARGNGRSPSDSEDRRTLLQLGVIGTYIDNEGPKGDAVRRALAWFVDYSRGHGYVKRRTTLDGVRLSR